MIKPHGSDTLNPLYVRTTKQRQRSLKEAETLPSLLLSSAAAANAVMLGGGYFNPLTGLHEPGRLHSASPRNMHTADGLFWPVPVVNMVDDVSAIKGAKRIALRDPNVEGNPVLAIRTSRRSRPSPTNR